MLVVGDAPYRPRHKSQDKPLELLKLLVACQVLGRDVSHAVFPSEGPWDTSATGITVHFQDGDWIIRAPVRR